MGGHTHPSYTSLISWVLTNSHIFKKLPYWNKLHNIRFFVWPQCKCLRISSREILKNLIDKHDDQAGCTHTHTHTHTHVQHQVYHKVCASRQWQTGSARMCTTQSKTQPYLSREWFLFFTFANIDTMLTNNRCLDQRMKERQEWWTWIRWME